MAAYFLLASLFVFVALASGQQDGLNFLAIGDWGGQTASPCYTQAEMDMGAGMGVIASQLDSVFTLALGDNFYETGLDGDVHDPRFQQTFEDVFTESSLYTPWYVVAGNHDYLGNVSAEIAYTALSSRWTFPSPYYTVSRNFTANGKEMTVQIIFIDTVILAGNTDKVKTESNPYPQAPGPEDQLAAMTQWQWIEEQIASSRADYLWVAGHYPVWSACVHGPTLQLQVGLRPLLQKYNVTGYLSGHDHCLEYISETQGGVSPAYVVTGAGKECCYSDENYDKVPKGAIKFLASSGFDIESGFVSVRHTETSASIVYHAQNGTVLFTSPALVPRQF